MSTALEQRIQEGKRIIASQVTFFKKNWGCVEPVLKEDNTPVSSADIAISDNIFALIKKTYPGDLCFSEESSNCNTPVPVNTEFCWLLDPIDGTNNFIRGFPMCAISLALLQGGMPVYGFIYDHSRDCIIEGGPGHGAFEEEHAVSVCPAPFNEESIIAMHFPITKAYTNKLDVMLTHRIRSLGSGTLNIAYTAVGIIEGCLDFSLKIWDFAAAYAILLGAQGEFHFLSAPSFPLKEFTTNQPKVGFYGGSPSFCNYIQEKLKAD